jgi:endonuclease/exonuclease/phosphatase (EEP) superfamily protein YafD
MFKYRRNNSSHELFLIHVYNHPSKSANQNFEDDFVTFMELNNQWVEQDLIVFGDFNIDFNSINRSTVELKQLLEEKFNLWPELENIQTRHKSGKQIDWIFATKSNEIKSNSSTYTTWFSDHNPLYTEFKFL